MYMTPTYMNLILANDKKREQIEKVLDVDFSIEDVFMGDTSRINTLYNQCIAYPNDTVKVRDLLVNSNFAEYMGETRWRGVWNTAIETVGNREILSNEE